MDPLWLIVTIEWHYLVKKASQERLPSRISAVEYNVNDDNGLLNLRCAKCKWRVERLRIAMMDEV